MTTPTCTIRASGFRTSGGLIKVYRPNRQYPNIPVGEYDGGHWGAIY